MLEGKKIMEGKRNRAWMSTSRYKLRAYYARKSNTLKASLCSNPSSPKSSSSFSLLKANLKLPKSRLMMMMSLRCRRPLMLGSFRFWKFDENEEDEANVEFQVLKVKAPPVSTTINTMTSSLLNLVCCAPIDLMTMLDVGGVMSGGKVADDETRHEIGYIFSQLH
ncbi:hypothetical protein CK203_046125 [Vitis vinifera]|uniref:Uncharacterized protein n=1 Tax=Vitis vinifera TaxID=29760 RepID=A0A438HNY3_VITVI|nr:hypothetical protein CK203_046125 [Vitis vinifera]